MVKNSHNNKVNNYINIVNDLKGLGLLQRKRRRQAQQQKLQPKIVVIVKLHYLLNLVSWKKMLESNYICQKNI